MKTTRPQSVNRKQVEQFLASAHIFDVVHT